MAAVLDRFMPYADESKRHEITIRAPAGLVLEVARHVDMQSIWIVRVLFWLRAKLLGARMPAAARRPTGLVAGMLALGWGCLADEPGHVFVAGAACQPWQADVVFSPIPPEQFAAYAEPDQVKIAWTLEAEALGVRRPHLAVRPDSQRRARIALERVRGGVFGGVRGRRGAGLLAHGNNRVSCLAMHAGPRNISKVRL